jgi:hypothetical protein
MLSILLLYNELASATPLPLSMVVPTTQREPTEISDYKGVRPLPGTLLHLQIRGGIFWVAEMIMKISSGGLKIGILIGK